MPGNRPQQHPSNMLKLERHMAAWRLGHDVIPHDIWHWILPLPDGERFAVVSPNNGGSAIARDGDWVIQAETGCLYAVTDAQFRRKYRLK